ncbi:g8237 [Coccomyxa elongata]
MLSDTAEGSSRDQARIRVPVDLDYKSPTERVWPASRHQQKFAGRVRDALQTVMMFTDSNAFKDLTGRYGFTVVEVRMSPDNSTAYILWDAFPECHEDAERELNQRTSRLRRSLAQALKSRHVPRLEFRRDAPSSEELAVEQALQRLQTES